MFLCFLEKIIIIERRLKDGKNVRRKGISYN